MPRPAMTTPGRIAKVHAAYDALPVALAACKAAASDPDVTLAERQALWERVETLGATIHRQSRFLAGKGKGG